MLATILFAAVLSAQARFVAADWDQVREAKLEIESGGAASLPFLMSLLERDDLVPLTDTGDLIYPGAKQFYGHGGVVNYDLDRISTRAGWALEDLTFENFGFDEWLIRQESKAEDVAAERRNAAIAAARAWYAKKQQHWTRYDGLKAALAGSDRARQLNALQWITYGVTACDGLTRPRFADEILPLVRALRTSADQSVQDEAKRVIGNRIPLVWDIERNPRHRILGRY